MTACFFHGQGPCFGRMDKAHYVPKQALKREAVADVWEPELWTPMCRLHHGQFDNYLIRITQADLPASTVDWFEAHGLLWMLDRYLPESEAA